ncbi:hypothetical protein MWT96_20480 [Prescottella equi]|uniref:hypothetical protein n=1 Tax=Rhodococcus hoagii TaxID=43767 RepID=UPI001981B465|nr:hypothetical protein [Prescottella equi]MCU7536678.1 hypothetical protein [Prescottella equi]UPH36703.1 hypothetical protein GS533_001220 [Prescottella equi]UPH40846.1 hypothetical protein MWT96_20480 [Prescottella equi]
MSDPITPALAHRVLDALEQSPHIGPDGSLSALFIIRDAVKAWEAESDREEEAEFYAKVYHRTRRRKSPVLAKWDSLPADVQADNIRTMRVVLDRLAAEGRLIPDGGTAPDVMPIGWWRTLELDFAAKHYGFPPFGGGDWTASDGGKWSWDEQRQVWELREYPPAAPDGTRHWSTAADVPDGVWFTSARLDDCKYRWLRCGKGSTDYADMADPKPTTVGFQVWDVSAVNDFAPFVSVGGAP